jgi:transposase
MEVEQFKQDVRQGRIGVDRLVELVVTLNRRLQTAERRVEELERNLGCPPSRRLDEPFSLRSEERRQEARGKKRRRRKRPASGGRKANAKKLSQAERTEKVFPAGVPEETCWLSHRRPVWRLENGQAVLVAYEIYRGPKNQYGRIPGVFGRSAFGAEIVLAIAYQVYVVGLSFDKVCLLMGFFQNLKLRKSQADALMNQLARAWEGEFEILCTLLANSLVVQTDETSWTINSVWLFLSEKARLAFFGVHKDAGTLREILDPATFSGIVVSDDAAVYANFTQSQKCWAHLLRKAIKLTLMEPADAEYRRFADRLLEIYRQACRVQRDRRLSAEGRGRKVGLLNDEVFDLCSPVWMAELPPGEGPADDYRRLCNELMRLLLAEQLFTFVTAEPVEQPNGKILAVPGTNNESERTIRNPVQARDTGRGSKTVPGARRRTIVVSVLESLRQYLSSFTLPSVIKEVGRWLATGRSCFARLAAKLGLTDAARPSVLNRLLPVPDG